MASGGKRRKSRPGHSASRSTHGQAADHIAAVTDGWNRIAQYLEDAENGTQVRDAARRDAREALRRAVQLARGRDLTRVLQSVRVTTTMTDARMAELGPVLLELLTLALYATDVAAAPDTAPGEPDWFPPGIVAAARQAWEAGIVLLMFGLESSDSFARVEFASRMREIALRNPVYPHMLLDTYRGLFGEPSIDADIKTVLGFVGLDAISVMEAARLYSVDNLQERFDRFLELRDAILPIMGRDPARPGRRSTPRAPAGASRPLSEEDQATLHRFREALEDLTTNVGDTAPLDVDAIAQRANVTPEVVVRVLETFEFQERLTIDEAVDRFFTGDNPLRTAPVLRDREGRFALVHDGLVLPAIREKVETALEDAGLRTKYQTHRGRWVEARAIDLLARHFPGAELHRGFKYFVPDPKASTLQEEPEKFTKRVEADGLIVVDDIAIVIEVKSVALTAEARGGGALKMRNKLRAIITDAAEQATRLRERIEKDRRVRLDDNEWIDCSNVREIHCVAVGLEDLSGVVTATAELVHAGILPRSGIPWTVSLHDLRAISEITDRPAELLLYIRRRTNYETTVKYLAIDELDLYLLFLAEGLFVEPDPVAAAEKYPLLGEPTVAELRRRKAERPGIVLGRTGPLDDWYNHQHRTSHENPPSKPAYAGPAELLALVDTLTTAAVPGWLAISATLLEANFATQRSFGQTGRRLVEITRRDGIAHDAVQVIVTSQGPVVLIWHTYPSPETMQLQADKLRAHVGAKKYQLQAARAAGFLFNAQTGSLEYVAYDNEPFRPDAQLDELVKRLKPIEAGRGRSLAALRPKPAGKQKRKRNS